MVAIGETTSVFDDRQIIKSLIRNAKDFLESNNVFASFDRLAFIKDYGDPLAKAIVRLQKSLNIPFVADARLLRSTASSLFEKNAFDINAFVQDTSFFISDAKVLLGKRLFYDPVLSGSGKRSCATCHRPEKAFTDGLTTTALLQENAAPRNTPTLLNAALQPSQFYDMRATNLVNSNMKKLLRKAKRAFCIKRLV